MAFALLCWLTTACADGRLVSGESGLGPGRHTYSFFLEGRERTYIVHVPPGYDSRRTAPVVVMLHGGGGTAQAAMEETGWPDKADRERFLAVFPNAMARDPSRPSSFAGNPQLWNDGSDRFYPGQRGPDDVGFIEATLEDLAARFAVDPRRIFVTGFSNGASMSFRVGAELSHRIAAIAPVAGACWLENVALGRPVPMLYITGDEDPLNPIHGGVPKLATGGSDPVRAKPKPPVRESILRWVRPLGLPETPSKFSDVNGVRMETYGPARDGSEVGFITVRGLGHTWPGGRSLLPERWVGKTSDKIHATNVIWDFFRTHGNAPENPR